MDMGMRDGLAGGVAVIYPDIGSLRARAGPRDRSGSRRQVAKVASGRSL